MANDNQDVRERFNGGRVAAGLIVLGLGVMMLVDRTALFDRDVMRLFPGVVLILIGLSQFVSRGCCSRRGRRRSGFGGLWLIIVGAWLIASDAHVFGLTYHTSWPLLIIAVGVLMVVRAFVPEDRGAGTTDLQGKG